MLLPIHWATFDLAFHEWSDPVEWLLQEADEGTLALPAPGGRVDPASGAADRPVVARLRLTAAGSAVSVTT